MLLYMMVVATKAKDKYHDERAFKVGETVFLHEYSPECPEIYEVVVLDRISLRGWDNYKFVVKKPVKFPRLSVPLSHGHVFQRAKRMDGGYDPRGEWSLSSKINKDLAEKIDKMNKS